MKQAKKIFSKYFYLIVLAIFVMTTTITIAYIIQKDNCLYTVEFVDELDTKALEKQTIKFCGFNTDNEFTLFSIEIDKTDDIYRHVFDLYNFKQNSLPVNCIIPSASLMLVDNMKVSGDMIVVTITMDDVASNEYERIFNAMKVTYSCLGIKTLKIIHGEKVYIY